MISALRRRLLPLAAALAVAACLSPTLPLPPPAEPSVSGPDEGGNVALEGRVTPGAWVFAVNRDSSTGAFSETERDGRYRIVLAAKAGDAVLLWYELDGNSSESVRVTIREP